MQDRWYQNKAVDDTMAMLDENPNSHPIIAMPTGSGKSHTACMLTDRLLTKNPTDNILIVSHVSEILEQNHASLERFYDVEIGLYSAGLGERTKRKITVAGIQSIYGRAKEFSGYNKIIVDECHRIPVRGEGMYRSFISDLSDLNDGDVNYIGLTATPFRLGHGYIHKGDGALFTDISIDLSSYENFNRLVEEGYLSRLINKRTLFNFDKDGLKKTGGDYNLKDMSIRFDRESITRAAINEIVDFGNNFKRWLIFAIDIKHAENISKMLESKGISSVCIHSKMKHRKEELAKSRHGVYRAIINVDILTTGYDDPQIDLIAILRPTESPVLHVQMPGRGLRTIYEDGYDLNSIDGRLAAIEASSKRGCLVLDFAGNIDSLGPINDVKVKQKGKSDVVGEAITKDCPECGAILHAAAKFCDNCGYEFIFKQKISTESTDSAIVRDQSNLTQWLNVDSVKYSIHQKAGSPSSLRVTYKTGFVSFSEWVSIDNPRARHMAIHWVKWRWIGFEENLPQNLNELYANVDLLSKPKRILVNNAGKFPKIIDYKFR